MKSTKKSYCQNIKEHLSSDASRRFGFTDGEPLAEKCCARSFLYGVMLFCDGFGMNEIVIKSENDSLLEMCAYVFIKYFNIDVDIKRRASTRAEEKYSISVAAFSDVIGRLYYSDRELSYYRINREVFECEECKTYFLKGAFLSSALLSDPDKEYHLEFVCSHKRLCEDLNILLSDMGFSPKTILRRRQYSIYFKDSNQIEDVLTCVGAQNFTLEIMQKKMYRSVRNNINRANNCDNANIIKTVDASIEVQKAIKTLKENGAFYSLPPKLRHAAEIRESYPDTALGELCKLFDPPISKSGLYHRLKKIVNMSQSINLRKE